MDIRSGDLWYFRSACPGERVTARTEGAPGLAPLIWLTRIGVYLGLFAGVGGLFFCIWIARNGAGSNVTAAALMVGLLCAVASLGLQGLDLLDVPFADIVTSAPWKAAAGTSLFPSLLLAITAIGAAIVAWLGTSVRVTRALSAAAMVGVGLSLTASGHASTAPPQWLSRPMIFLHGIGVVLLGSACALTPLAAMENGSRRGRYLPS